MSPDCTICYVSDLGFMLPTLVSANSVRKFIAPHQADIVIFTVGVDADKILEIGALMQPSGIRVQSIDAHVFESIDQGRLSATHTNLATFGRFFMEGLLPAACRRIVYLDGDVLCTRSPAQLVEAVVPEGRFAAADDAISYRRNLAVGSTAKRHSAYFSRLGLDPAAGYFNAGVFAVSRATWKIVADEAYRYFLANTDRCIHFDQSALNAIMGGRRLRLSAKWNLQTQLRIWGVDNRVEPRVYHFNRNPKPWMGACDPWAEMHQRYQDMMAPLASLRLPLRTISAEDIHQTNASIRRQYSYLHLPFASGAALRLMQLPAIERSAWM
jgi:lipopolysaccharide biosynthesis glycosyltransferase